MNTFWIITKNRLMYLQPAVNKEAATEKFNDCNAIKADVTFPTEQCICGCGKLLEPDIPKWMEYTLASTVKWCSKQKTIHVEDENGKPCLDKMIVGNNLDKYFTHLKSPIA